MSHRPGEQNFYEVLEVPTDAPQHEIREAYLRAKDTYSPDSPALYTMFTKEEAQQLRNLIEEAFLVLGDQIKRQKYDAELKGEDAPTELPDFEQPANQTKPPLEEGTETVPNEVPEGFSKTKLSVHEKDESFEEELATLSDFDGEILKKVRLYKNIEIEQLSKETRISKRYINAIENNDFGELPAPVFVRGFVVQLARLLGLNEAKVATSYMALLKSAQANESKH